MIEHRYKPETIITCDGSTAEGRPCEVSVEAATDDDAVLIAETIGFVRTPDGRWLCRDHANQQVGGRPMEVPEVEAAEGADQPAPRSADRLRLDDFRDATEAARSSLRHAATLADEIDGGRNGALAYVAIMFRTHDRSIESLMGAPAVRSAMSEGEAGS